MGGLLGASMLSYNLYPVSTALANSEQPEFVESSCGAQGKRILVAYESLCGTTSQVADKIAQTLCSQELKVDVQKISSIRNISGYDGAIIGSAVRSAAWHPEAINFVKRHQDSLSQIPVAYFLTCLALYYNTPQANAIANSYFDPVLKAVPQVIPKTSQAFAGVLNYDKLNLVVRMVMKSKMKKRQIPEGDFRDFKKIETWAQASVIPAMVAV